MGEVNYNSVLISADKSFGSHLGSVDSYSRPLHEGVRKWSAMWECTFLGRPTHRQSRV